MTYHVLARKWRSQTFADLVGQTHVVKALTFALSQNQVHHAYLFTGTRGVGKTSIARIFAKSLNCETHGVTATPCGTCESCREITAGKFVDLIEVDAASRTGVDETRELIDSVAYLPTKGRYKVYLIDEVHMFSKSSFNALLKTLEEPPAHVKFILATTDPEKLPITILSRCLQFNLKSLTSVQIRKHLQNICHAENIAYDDKALALLANAGDGSMRDALSITDQAIAYGQGQLRLETVTEILGTIHPADIELILFAIATNNPNQLGEALQKLEDYELDARAFLIEIMHQLQQMAWAKEGVVKSLSDNLLSTVNDIPKPLIHLWYDIAEKALPTLSASGEAREKVEMTLLRMLAFIPDDWVTRHRTVLSVSESSSAGVVDEVTDKATDKATATNPPVSLAGTDTAQVLGNNKAEDNIDNTVEDKVEGSTEDKSEDKSEENIQDNVGINPSLSQSVHPTLAATEATPTVTEMPAEPAAVIDEPTPAVVNSGSPQQVHARAVEPQASLDEAVAQFQQSADSVTEVTITPADVAAPVEATVSEAWHLAEEPSTEPTDFNAVKNLMQSGRDIRQPALKTEVSPHVEAEVLPHVEAEISPHVEAEVLPHVEANTPENTVDTRAATVVNWEPLRAAESTAPASSAVSPIESTPTETVATETAPTEVASALSDDRLPRLLGEFDWNSVYGGLNLTKYTRHFAGLGIIRPELAGQGVQATFDLPPKNAVIVTDESITELQTVLSDYFRCAVTVAVNLTELQTQTPAELAAKQTADEQSALLARFRDDERVAYLVNHFGGEVLEKKVKPTNNEA